MNSSVLLASQNLNTFDPASPAADSIRNLAYLVLAITGGIFVVVEIILIYSIVCFRRRATTSTSEPPQVYGSSPIEIAWTAAPGLIVFVLALVVTRTLLDVVPDQPEPKKDDDAVFVTVTGRQWWWEYQYNHHNGERIRATGLNGDEDLIAANELHIPADVDRLKAEQPRRTYLKLMSADVAHSYWVPRLHGKTDLIPGKPNFTHLQSDKPGLYVGQCAEYCGTQHANMLLRVYVDSPEKFAIWLDNQKQPAKLTSADPDTIEGQRVFLAQSCVNCHRVRGTTAKGNYAPDLTHLMSRERLAAGMIDNNEDNLNRWIADPQKIKPGCLMPAFGLSDRDRKLLVKYLLTLK